MMKKLGFFIVVVGLMTFIFSAAAQAVPVPTGPMIFHIHDAGSNYRGGVPLPAGTILLPGDEDRSVGNIDTIHTSDGPPGWTAFVPATWTSVADDGTELGFLFYDHTVLSSTITGIASLDPDGGGALLGSVTVVTKYGAGPGTYLDLIAPDYGGRVDIFHDLSPDWATALNAPNAGPGAWTAGVTDDYPGISYDDADFSGTPTAGDTFHSLWLTGSLVPMGIDPISLGTVIYDTTVTTEWNDVDGSGTVTAGDTFGGIVLGGTNTGTAFMNILGGTAMSQFVPGGFTTPTFLLPADILFQVTFIPGGSGWQTTSADPVRAYGVPEPSTIILLGCALLGLGLLRSKKKKIR